MCRRPPPPSGQGAYIFQDEFDGPAGSAPDGAKWHVARAREPMKDPTYWELPEHVGQYRDDRQNVFPGWQLQPCHPRSEGRPHFLQRQADQQLARRRRPHLGGPGQTRLPDRPVPGPPGGWETTIPVAKSTSSSGTATGAGPSATTVHAKSNGSRVEDPQHRGRRRMAHLAMPSGTRPESASGRTTPTALSRTSPLPANSLPDWPFNNPGYTVYPVLNLAVAGSGGGGDPGPGTYPAQMLVDYVRVW